jgi:hypothetical protein
MNTIYKLKQHNTKKHELPSMLLLIGVDDNRAKSDRNQQRPSRLTIPMYISIYPLIAKRRGQTPWFIDLNPTRPRKSLLKGL